MNWTFFLFISIFSYSFSVLLQKVLLKKTESSPIALSILFQFTIGILIGIFGLFFAKMAFPPLRPLLWNLVIMVVFYALANIFIFKSLKQIDASIFTIIMGSRVLFTVLASSLLLHEILNPKQWMGAFFIFFSIFLINFTGKKFSFGKGAFFALLAALFVGFVNTNDRYLLQSFEIYFYTAIAFLAPAILMAFCYPKELSRVKTFLERDTLKRFVLLCILYGISTITFYAALQIGNNSSQIAVINLTSVILTVLLAILFLKEREGLWRKVIGAVLCFIGVILLL